MLVFESLVGAGGQRGADKGADDEDPQRGNGSGVAGKQGDECGTEAAEMKKKLINQGQ